MKKFTRLFLFLIATMFSISLIAQSQQALVKAEKQMIAEQLQAESQAHGPTVDVPQATEGSRAVGDDCTTPIVINSLPFTDMGNTTCGRGNTYFDTDLGSYDGGEDIIYELVLASDMDVIITMNPNGTTWSGLGLFSACPGANSIAIVTSSTSDPRIIQTSLTAGTYYIMADTWPSPTCIPSLDLTVEEFIPPDPADPIDTFPYMVDFEDGSKPDVFDWFVGGQSAISVIPAAANGSSFGQEQTGGTSTGWPTFGVIDAATAFSYTDHVATTKITLIPSGDIGMLMMELDMYIESIYSTSTYAFYRVLVNGTEIADQYGEIYYNTGTTYGGTKPWDRHSYNLSAWQNDPQIEVEIQTTCKYTSEEVYLDNFEFFYLTVGNIEGTVYDATMTPVPGAPIFVDGVEETSTDLNGFYQLMDLPAPATYQIATAVDGLGFASMDVDVEIGLTTTQDFAIFPAILVASPLEFDETLNPNEYLTTQLGLTNAGMGDALWNAEIEYTSKAPAQAAESYPKYDLAESNIVPGTLSDPLATDRSAAGDINNGSSGTRAVGDVIEEVSPTGIQPWGIAFDGEFMYLTDPFGALGTTVQQYNLDGTPTGNNIDLSSSGATWIGDMACDGDFLYCTMVGGANNILVVEISTGDIVDQISGPFNTISQRGLAYDQENEEFYIGGWNDNTIYRLDASGNLIDQFPWNGISGIAWHPQGGPDAEGALWVVANEAGDLVTEFDPNNGWANLQSFVIPNGIGFSGAGLELNSDGNLWVVNQSNQTVYLVDTEEPLSGVSGGWLSLEAFEGELEANGGNVSLDVNFDATGFMPGDVASAIIHIVNQPNVQQIDIPVTMTIFGDPLMPVEDLEAVLTNEVTGEVSLSWSFSTRAEFQFFRIYRDGQVIATTTQLNYTDFLPAFGTYSYEVSAQYDEGEGVPAGPAVVDWLIPDFCFSPAMPENAQWPNVQENVPFTIENCGQGTLQYTFPKFAARNLLNDPSVEKNNTAPIEGYKANEEKGAQDMYQGHPVMLGAGGPDGFGYSWIDSDEVGGPTYDWIEISGIGTDLGLSGDDESVSISLPFSFPFYGENKNSLSASTNGYLTFGTDGTDFSNDPIPSATDPNDFIAAFWDDLNFTGAATLYSYYDATNNYFVIQYQDVPRLGSTDVNTFQYILYPNGFMKMQYKSMTGLLTSATVGIENADATDGLQIAFNTTYVKNNLAVMMMPPIEFIVDVIPATGTVSEGNSVDVTLVYSSEVWNAPGTYMEDLMVETNAPAPNDMALIPNTMIVYTPGGLFGQVTDCNTGAPIPNVTVTATSALETYTTETGPGGNYMMMVDEDTYDVVFELLGKQTVVVADTFAMAGMDTEVSVAMCEELYPPVGVFADPNQDDTECLVTWSHPEGSYIIIYDDGSAENFFVWSGLGGVSAVKFSPDAYPARVRGGRIFVGDGSFPDGANFLGSTFGIAIHDDDGPNGAPGTVRDSISVTVNNYGWVSFEGLNAVFTSGEFYMAMYQSAPTPFAAPVGVDETAPTAFRSYVRAPGSDQFSLSPFQDFMMRAIIFGNTEGLSAVSAGAETLRTPKIPAEAMDLFQSLKPFVGKAGQLGTAQIEYMETNEANRDVNRYQIARISDFDPNLGETPQNDGVVTILGTVSPNTFSFNDLAWNGLDMGWYAFAVRARYPDGGNNTYSEWRFSNIVGRLMDVSVTFEVTQCDGGTPDLADVLMVGNDYPFTTYADVTDATGIIVFDSVIKGLYDVSVNKAGYELFAVSETILTDKVYEVVLAETPYPARNLFVEPLTSLATWETPIVSKVEDGFEGSQFPPAGWQSVSNSVGWYQTDDGSGPAWPVPAWDDGLYAVSNDDAAGSVADGSNDYLITPPMDLRESDDFKLFFNSFFNPIFGLQLATVEYTTDGGATWEVYSQLTGSPNWESIEIDLAPLSGEDGLSKVWFGFHADDNGGWASGWAIDNVFIANGLAEPTGYLVFLDGAFVAETPADVLEYTYQELTYGVEYTASVVARYSCGLSDPIFYTFTSTYLYPPRNLFDTYEIGPEFDDVPLYFNPPITGPQMLANSAGSYPKYDLSTIDFTPGVLADELALNRAEAQDIVHSISGARAVGDVIEQVSPTGIQPWGIAFDGEFVYLTDPFGALGTIVQQYNLDGTPTGFTIDLTSSGATWIGDMACDGDLLYCTMVGGSNQILVVDIETGTILDQISGPFTGISQRGLAYDEENEEFYIGGWNDNIIYRVDASGNLIDQFPWNGISGLAWHPQGGPDAEGSLWVVANAADDLVTEFDPNNGWVNLQSFGIPNGVGFSGAGLELNTDGNLWVVNQSNQTVYLVDTEEPLTIGPPSGTVPDGLLSFNIYRDDLIVGNVPYEGQSVDDTLLFVDVDVPFGCYTYNVTAVYDLSIFGFPGETGESAFEGPVDVCVYYGFPIPFEEDWTQGSFGFNSWQEGENWRIQSQIGNPEPSAEFVWDPQLENYSDALVSNPFFAYEITEGDIWLDFEISLVDRNETGTEMMLVEVFDGNGWNQVASFSNTGDFDFTYNHINISQWAIDDVFQVRFNAMGENSFNINSWYVDNINIYRTCDAPQKIDGIYGWDAADQSGYIEINWEAPDIPLPIREWLGWNNGVEANGIGLTDGGEFWVAARWDAGQLAEYEGTFITKVRIALNDAGFTSVVPTLWTGANASTTVWETESTTPNIGDWTEFTVDPPVELDTDLEWWVGYKILGQPAGTFPAGVDLGPAITGYGDMITTNGTSWDALSEIAPTLDFNWTVEMFVEELTGTFAVITPQATQAIANPATYDFSVIALDSPIQLNNSAEREFTGFNLYRKNQVDDLYNLVSFIPFEDGVLNYLYRDQDEILQAGESYCYQVTAVYESDVDFCESMPAAALVIPMDDFVCVLFTSTDEINVDMLTEMYPNPTRDQVRIKSGLLIERITFVNYLGQVVIDEQINTYDESVNTSRLENGVYLVRIQTDKGLATKRLVISR